MKRFRKSFTRRDDHISFACQDENRKVELRKQLSIKDVDGMTLLAIAVRSGSMPVVRAVLSGMRVLDDKEVENGVGARLFPRGFAKL